MAEEEPKYRKGQLVLLVGLGRLGLESVWEFVQEGYPERSNALGRPPEEWVYAVCVPGEEHWYWTCRSDAPSKIRSHYLARALTEAEETAYRLCGVEPEE